MIMARSIDDNIERAISSVINTIYNFFTALYDYYYFVPPKKIEMARQPS